MSIAASLSNNLTTSGVFKAAAVNNTSCDNITTFASIPAGGALVLLSTQTASASASIDFTSNIDSTYDSYIFKFIDLHPSVDAASLVFQADTGTNTNYNLTMTTTMFRSYHSEDDLLSGLGYITGEDQAQGTAFQKLIHGSAIGSDNDQSGVGTLQVFNPSSSTLVKHFISRTNAVHQDDISMDMYVAGYFNLTTPITRFRFKMDSGNIDDGIIKLYGVKKS
jgi:hypothetical protein